MRHPILAEAIAPINDALQSQLYPAETNHILPESKKQLERRTQDDRICGLYWRKKKAGKQPWSEHLLKCLCPQQSENAQRLFVRYRWEIRFIIMLTFQTAKISDRKPSTTLSTSAKASKSTVQRH